MPVSLADLVEPAHTAVLTMEVQRGVVGDLSSFPQLAEAVDRVGVVPNTARLPGATAPGWSTARPSSGPTGPARWSTVS